MNDDDITDTGAIYFDVERRIKLLGTMADWAAGLAAACSRGSPASADQGT
jgi:hypothetical protein